MLISAVLLLPAGLGAVDLAMNGNPYTPIVTRNIFGLVPIPTNPPAIDPASLNPPPKITPNGIMTIFGIKEALFKVAIPAKPGKPAADQAYTLGEGESQDDIEVVKIDETAAVITFNNHGSVQELPLVVGTASGDSGSSLGGGSGVAASGAHFPRPIGGPGFAARRGLPVPSNPTVNNNGADSSSPGLSGAGVSSTGINDNEMNGLSPEAKAILIESQRAQWQSENNPAAAIIPPTAITPHDDSPEEPVK